MKKLLILGGSRYILPVIESAHKLGIFVITADYLPENIAHKYSDRYENISVIDKDRILAFAEKEKIDGISAFACDAAVVSAAYVADKMGLPSPGPYKSIEILQNKGQFRQYLSDNGFVVPFFDTYSNWNEVLKDSDRLRFPVIVKPIDSCGSKGVTRVDKIQDLEKAVQTAIGQSFCGKFIIEEFIEQLGFASDSEFFSVDGDLRVATFSSQRFDRKADNPYTPAAFSWPSHIPQGYQDELTSEIQRLLLLLNMGTAIYNVEARVGVDGRAYIMEVSPRGGGNRLAECIRYATGIDMIENSVRASVGMDLLTMDEFQYDGHWAEIVIHSRETGAFEKLEISEDIKKYIVELDLWVNEGETISSFVGANNSIGTIIFRFDSTDTTEKVLQETDEYIKVIVR